MSKFTIANLASAFVLTAAISAFAAPDPTPPTAPADPAPAAAPADPATPATPAAPAPAPVKAAKKQPLPTDIICRPDTGTGSRVGGEKICMTRADWRKRDMGED